MSVRTTCARVAGVAALVAIAALAPACAHDGGASSAAPKATSTTTTSVAPFNGPGDFYDAPSPLTKGKPGDLIRYQPVATTTNADRTLWRVMYHSQDARDRDVAVTGLVSVPTATAPSGGWPVLSWGHGTSGLAPQCAPSRTATSVPEFGIDGVVAASDFPGLGPNGQRHSYLSGVSEGHSVIDAVRAAGHLPGATTSSEWAAAGISQGGHAVLFASELAHSYAPELKLVGTVAMAPATELDRSFPGDVPLVVRSIQAMALYGIAEDHPEIVPKDYASPTLQAASAVLDDGCVAEIASSFGAIPSDQLWTTDPYTTDLGKRIAQANSPGQTVFDAPLLVVQGDKDLVVAPARTDAYVQKVCAEGQNLSRLQVPGADHNLKSDEADAQIAAWLQARFAHQKATSEC